MLKPMEIILWNVKYGSSSLIVYVQKKRHLIEKGLTAFLIHLYPVLRKVLSSWERHILPFIVPTNNLCFERLVEYPKAWEYLALDKKDLILDIGSGTSCFASLISKKGFKMISLDRDSDRIIIQKRTLDEFSEKIRYNLQLIVADARFLPFKNVIFDKIMLISVIEHISEDKVALKEIRRVLKEKGSCVLSFPYSLASETPESEFDLRSYTEEDIVNRILKTTQLKIKRRYLFRKQFLKGIYRVIPTGWFILLDFLLGKFVHELENLFGDEKKASICVLKLTNSNNSPL
jgi:ubiquinone/menaquinone biosynthesis C-methylase UbiE